MVLCGVSLGASLAFEVAGRAPKVAGVIGICPPFKLHDYSPRFMPSIDVWNRMVKRLKGGTPTKAFEFASERPHVNYRRNPVTAVREVERLLEVVAARLPKLTTPALILQAENDPVVSSKGSLKVFSRLGSKEKHYSLFNLDRHIIIDGEGADRVNRAIGIFIDGL